MPRYFFDFVKGSGVTHDYEGRDLPGDEQARRQGELIAIDLQIGTGGEWAGWEVSVRDARGREVFSIPVPADEG